MNTEEKYGLKKSSAILLFVQMIWIVIALAMVVYLLIFIASNHLGGWMLASYIFILLSILSIIGYGVFGYRKGEVAYLASVAPFMVAVLVNIIMPGRNAYQIATLTILFALTFGFLLRQKDEKFNLILSLAMIVASLAFSIYSAITANTQFLGEISSSNWLTYLAMYLSIFIPVIVSITFALTYNVRVTKNKSKQ